MKTYPGVKITFVSVVIFCVASTVRFYIKIGNPYAAEFGGTTGEGGGAVRNYKYNINSNNNGTTTTTTTTNNNNGTTTTSLRRIKENIKQEKQKEINTRDDDVKIKTKQKEKDDDDDDDDDSVVEVTPTIKTKQKEKDDDDDDDDDSVVEVTPKDDEEQEGEESNEKTNAAFLFDTKSSGNNSFSACIMWMDDNHRLEEWLAYHYYIMKLRYVVIAVDQKSITSPQHIVDRWNDNENKYNLNMTIITWKDPEYISDYGLKMKGIEMADSISILKHGSAKTQYHRYRQHEFYRMCSTHLLKQNRTWVCTCFVLFFLFCFDKNSKLIFSHTLLSFQFISFLQTNII
jgi:hypothetical protein